MFHDNSIKNLIIRNLVLNKSKFVLSNYKVGYIYYLGYYFIVLYLIKVIHCLGI
jgi:hypothetical protein